MPNNTQPDSFSATQPTIEVIERFEKGEDSTYSINGGEFITKDELISNQQRNEEDE